MRIITIIWASFFIIGCNNNNEVNKLLLNCNGKIDTISLQSKYNHKKKLVETSEMRNGKMHGLQLKYFPNGKIHESQYYIDGNYFGDNEIYFNNGSLKKYQFLVDSTRATFIRTYDENGLCVDNEGTPCGFKEIGTNKSNDTLRITFVFADKIFSKLQIKISSDGITYKNVSCQNYDCEFPFNKTYKYVQDISKEKPVSIFLKINATDKLSKEDILYNDTLNLTKKYPRHTGASI